MSRLKEKTASPKKPQKLPIVLSPEEVLQFLSAASAKILLFDEPTRGVDVKAKGEIRRLIAELASGGAAIIVASSELPETIAGMKAIRDTLHNETQSLANGVLARKEPRLGEAISEVQFYCAEGQVEANMRTAPRFRFGGVASSIFPPVFEL